MTERLTVALPLVLFTDTSLCPLDDRMDINQPVGHQVTLTPSPCHRVALESGSLSQSVSPWSQSQPRSFYPSQQPPNGTGHPPQRHSVEQSHLKNNVGDFALLFPNLCGLLRLQPDTQGPSQPGPGIVSPGSSQRLAPSEWTSGARIKATQYCSCQKRGLTWHPLPGCPENGLRPEVCSPEAATHWKCLVTHTMKQRQMATPLVLSWGSLSTPLSLCWGPLDLGTPLCC